MLISARFFHNRTHLFRIAGSLTLIIVIFLIRLYITSDAVVQKPPPEPAPSPPAPPPPPPPLPRHPLYKPPKEKASIPIEDNFPRAARAHSSADLPKIPSWNNPPTPHVSEPTPVFIGFTRNWRLLQQVVVSLITGGWPPEDIYVVENTGTMDANKNVQLSLQNPFYLDYYRLTEILGVNVITTPTLLTFAQLQNFFLYEAITKGYPTYFWAHMDGAALSDEKRRPYQSFYNLSVEALRESQGPKYGRWAIRFFAYDHFALVNTKAYVEVGGWDTQIPFYLTDCDMHERLMMRGFKLENAGAGQFFDLAEAIDDLEELYRKKKLDDGQEGEEEDELGGAGYDAVNAKFGDLQHRKVTQQGGRNTWQAQQAGGQGEPYYRDPDGFEQAIRMTIDHGKHVYSEKWGHRECDLRGVGLSEGDAWKVEHDWDRPVSPNEEPNEA